MHALIIASVWPEPRSSAAGIRTLHLADALRQADFTVSFASASKENEALTELRELGYDAQSIQLNNISFDEWIAGIAPDLVVFDRFMTEEQFGARVRARVPNAARVIDTVDLHFLRGLRQRAAARVKSAAVEVQVDEAQLRELAALYRSDLSLLVSEAEMKLLVEEYGFPKQLLRSIRFGYPPAPQPPGFKARRGFGMIGNFRHPPNRDGFDWLRTEIWPRIRKLLPDAEVKIHGSYPPRECMGFDSPKTGFRVLGWTPDARASLGEIRVNLAPLRFGAGIKGKISDGWWSGTPVVTTPVGAEAMAGALPWPGAVVTDPDEFAHEAVRLHQDQEHWEEMSARAPRVMSELYDERKLSAQIGQEMRALLAELAERRTVNIVGSILWHQSMRSTEYFSRWIEVKNRVNDLI